MNIVIALALSMELLTYQSSGYTGSPTNCAMVSYMSLVVTSSPLDPFEQKIMNIMATDKYFIMIFVNETMLN